MRRPPSPTNSRNGLKWRDGRPRWEPSPASRACGLRGVDLKDEAGAWIAERGFAIAHCDALHLWAQLIREAAGADPGAAAEEARADLRAVLEDLAPPATPEQRLRRFLIQPLVDHARRLLDGQDAAAGVRLVRGVRTVERLYEAYLAAVDARKVKISAATREAYAGQGKLFTARFAGRGVGSIKRKELVAWYAEMVDGDDGLGGVSLSLANLRLAAAGALLRYAWDEDWIPATPAQKLGLRKPDGRLVMWTLGEETAYVAWCDAQGFEDVADAVTLMGWTGANPVDACGADLEDLAGEVWRYDRVKTGQAAMPGLLQRVKDRVARRRLAAAQDRVRALDGRTPYLWNVKMQRRHDPGSLGRRHREAKAAAIAADQVPETLAAKRLQDLRDSCITRLWEADVPPARMWPWTGHSQEDVEQILKAHYIVIREQGMLELAAKLEAWAKKEAVGL